MRVLIIIPAYNEAENIKRVITNLTKNFPEYDYVIVNDGSADKTADICKANKFNFINLPVNLGLAGAFQSGMRYAFQKGYDAALQFDGDGQHRPEYIKSMVQRMEETNADIVIGSRFAKERKPLTLRMLGSRVLSFLIFITTFRFIKDPTSGMRLYNKTVLDEYANKINYGPEPDTLAYLLNRGCKIEEIQVTMDERLFGTSYLNVLGSMHYMLKMCVSIMFVQWFRKRG